MIPKYWIPLHTQYDTTETKFCMVIKLRGKLLQRPLRPGPVEGSEGTQILSRMLKLDLFAVANLVCQV